LQVDANENPRRSKEETVNDDEDSVRDSVLSVLALLAEGEYETVANLTRNDRFTAKQIQDEIEKYGRTLKEPPREAPPNVEVVEVVGARPREYRASTPFWTIEEGRSDLTLEMTYLQLGDYLWMPHIREIRAK
jgi:hypothetical protein